jgi:hypothetical protein
MAAMRLGSRIGLRGGGFPPICLSWRADNGVVFIAQPVAELAAPAACTGFGVNRQPFG